MTDSRPISQQALDTFSLIHSLQSNRKTRDQQKAFFIEGVRNFVQVCDHQYTLNNIIYSEKLCTSALARKLVRQRRRAGTPTLSVSPEQFRSISKTERASGVAAIVKQRWGQLNDINHTQGSWLIFDHVRSSGNLGTLIRSAEAFGNTGFIFLGNSIDPYSPDIVRASMAAVFRQTFIRSNNTSLKSWLKKHNHAPIGASPEAQSSFQSINYPQPCFLFLGNERKGLSTVQRHMCSSLVSIPMVGQGDSLNLGVAGSLLLYEVFRSSGMADNYQN